MKHTLLALILLLSISCKQLLLWKEGITQPALESYASLKDYLSKNEIDTSEILCFEDTLALGNFYRRKIGLPDSRFFNRQMKLVDYRQSPNACNGQVGVFLEKIDSINFITPVPGESLESYLNGVVHAHDLSPIALPTKMYDAYLIIFWAKYLGNINKRKVFDWTTLVADAEKRGVFIKVFLINADFQKSWKVTKEDVPKFKY